MKRREDTINVVMEMMFSAVGEAPVNTLEISRALWEERAGSLPFSSGDFRFVYTRDLLVHVALSDLIRVCAEMVRISNEYIGCVEIFSSESDSFWNDVGMFYHYHFPNLELVAGGALLGEGKESVRWWVFRKPIFRTDSI